MAFIRKIKAGLVKQERIEFVGEDGNIFFDIDNGAFYLSDGVTPGGIPLGGGGGGGISPGDNVSLLTNDAGYTVPGDNISVFTNDANYTSTGDNISVFTNDANYITLTDLSASGDLTYNNLTGEFSVTTYKSTDFDADFANKSIAELQDVADSLNLQEDSILIYNINTTEFTAETFQSVIERLRTELEIMYDKLVDEDTAGAGLYTYIGESAPGSAKGDAVWRIKRVEELTGADAGDIEILWANGTAAFDKVWDDRATYTY